jgi:FkbM family methyltransferase
VNATLRRLIDTAAAPVICARIVRESPAFFLRELLRPAGVRVYHTRATGVGVAVRHRGVDAATLAEVFYHRWYEPPAEVAAALREPRAILDLGANIGMFGAFAMTAWPRATIVGYEPDPANYAVHLEAIGANRAAGERWSVVQAAAGAGEGEVRLASGLGPSSHLLAPGASGEHELVVALHDVLEQVSGSDLVKIDIEGGEWAIIGDQRFASDPPGVVVLEYHPENCPGRQPRAEAVRLLESAGMRTRVIWDAEGDGLGMLWGWRGP